MIAASPSSGSSFFKRAIRESHPEKEYKSEFFTELFSPKIVTKFTNSMPQLTSSRASRSHLENYYQQNWNPDKYFFTKEVFVHSLIPFFHDKFFISALYRHRKFTFPTRKDSNFKKMYGIFINVSYSADSFLYQVQSFLKKESPISTEKHCAAHIIFNYILFKFCENYKLPIINYEDLMTLNETELNNYLKYNLPDFVFTSSIARSIINTREKNPFLLEKEKAYKKLNVEPFCQKLIAFMKNYDQNMSYWNLLE